MQRLSFLPLSFFVLFATISAFAGESFPVKFEAVQNEVDALCQTPFTGSLEEYPPYAEKIGTQILVLVDPLMNDSEATEENKTWLVEKKNLGLIFRYGFDDAQYKKHYEKFLDETQDYKLNRQWVAKQFYDERTLFYDDEKIPKAEKAEKFSQIIDRLAPQINKYFNDEKRISNEQLPSIIVTYSAMLDPDGSLGVVRSTVEKLRPILEADAKRRKGDLLGFCAQSALNSIRRLDMVGKPLEHFPTDLDNQPVNVSDRKGKTIFIVTAPSKWDEEKIAPLKKLYDSLKSPNFEMIVFCDDDPAVAKERLQNNGETWTVVGRYGNSGSKEIDYTDHWGTYDIAIIVDPEGIASYIRTDGFSPEICEKLASLFPEQAKQITEIANEIRTIDEEKHKADQSGIVQRNPDMDENIPPTVRKLYAFYRKIVVDAPPEMVSKLLDVLLSSKDLPQYTRSSLLERKVDILEEIARQNVEKHPEIRPEIVYREVLEFADKLLAETSDSSSIHGLLYPKYQALYHMREYLKKMESGQEEYATEITRRFVEISKQAPDSFFHNSNMFVMFYRDQLEDIDMEHGTHLQQSFLEQVIPVFAASKSLEYQQEAKRLEKALQGITLVGKEMEFEMIALDGSKVNLKDFRGKIVLVNFWATWCGPCIREFPNMKTQYEKYKPLGFEMLAYSIDSEYEDILAFQKKNQYPWINGSWLKSKEAGMSDYHSEYGVRGVPATFLVDRDGKVVFRLPGSDDEALNKELEKIFGGK